MRSTIAFVLLSLLFVGVVSDNSFGSNQKKAEQQKRSAHDPASPPKNTRKIKRYRCIEEVVEVTDEQPLPPSLIVDNSEFEPKEQPKGEPNSDAQSPKVVDEPTKRTTTIKPTTENGESKESTAKSITYERIDIPEPKVNRARIDEKAKVETTKEELNSEQLPAPTPKATAQSAYLASLPDDAPRARAIPIHRPENVAVVDQKYYQLADVQCNAIKATASTYRVKDVRGWVRKNCAIAKMYLPSATCEELNMYVDSCYK
uniref:aECM cysteine-cradle domain-containing protein n=1 Tax=Plectus sambesii TaxID=2011161 RepID=A0A914VJD3_9BILA